MCIVRLFSPFSYIVMFNICFEIHINTSCMSAHIGGLNFKVNPKTILEFKRVSIYNFQGSVS